MDVFLLHKRFNPQRAQRLTPAGQWSSKKHVQESLGGRRLNLKFRSLTLCDSGVNTLWEATAIVILCCLDLQQSRMAATACWTPAAMPLRACPSMASPRGKDRSHGTHRWNAHSSGTAVQRRGDASWTSKVGKDGHCKGPVSTAGTTHSTSH